MTPELRSFASFVAGSIAAVVGGLVITGVGIPGVPGLENTYRDSWSLLLVEGENRLEINVAAGAYRYAYAGEEGTPESGYDLPINAKLTADGKTLPVPRPGPATNGWGEIRLERRDEPYRLVFTVDRPLGSGELPVYLRLESAFLD